jgi:light-regulated signal transduction histidine kinase (bacteriophytochrome)
VKDANAHIYCTFVNDITERLEIERKRRQINQELERRVQERTAELQRSNEELHQFAKVASHDLQEPLRSIEGFADLLAKRYKDRLDHDANEFIDFILEGTNRMEQLIQAVLAHSRISEEGEKTEAPLTDVNSVIKEVLANLSQSISETGATFDIGTMPTVRVDRSQLIQLFQNLINNAIKYTGSNIPHISVSAELNVGEWLFSVQDNGIGIDSKYAERIFDMFARLHGRTKYSGTGMGLAICKKIVTTHGGRIWMESEVGQGSIFFFTLPAQIEAKESL